MIWSKTKAEKEEEFAETARVVARELIPLSGTLSQQRLLHQIKPAYDRHQSDGQLT